MQERNQSFEQIKNLTQHQIWKILNRQLDRAASPTSNNGPHISNDLPVFSPKDAVYLKWSEEGLSKQQCDERWAKAEGAPPMSKEERLAMVKDILAKRAK